MKQSRVINAAQKKQTLFQFFLHWLGIKTFFKEETSSGNYFAPLTGLRGLAALIVLFFHVVLVAPIHESYGAVIDELLLFYHNGFLGIYLFFVLSGFLLSFSFLSAQQKNKKSNLKQFAINRCLRVLPSYYVQIIILSLATWLFIGVKFSPYDIIMHLLMLHNLDISTSGSMNAVYWTLPIEWNFYYALPLLSLFFLKGRWFWLIIISLVLGLGSRVLIGEVFFAQAEVHERVWIATQIFAIPEYFLFGMAGAYWRFKLDKNSWPIRYGDVIMIVGAILLIIGIKNIKWWLYWTTPQHYWWNAYAPLALTLFVFGASAQQRLSRLLWTNRFMMVLGILSYGIYLWHWILLEKILNKLNIIEWLNRQGASELSILLILTGILLIITLIVSYLNYRFVEKPFINLKRKN